MMTSSFKDASPLPRRGRGLALLALLALSTSAAACSDDDSTSGSQDIVATAQAAGTFNTLVAALKAADLEATLKGPGPFTVFAPTDAAFAKLPAGTVESLLRPENKAKLTAILTYHVVAGRVASGDVVGLVTAKSVEGRDIKVSVSGSTVKLNDATVTTVDIAASNGIIHVIDTVLLPPENAVVTAEAKGFSTLTAAIKAAELEATLSGPGPFTVFAPTDAAFAKLPAGTLQTLLMPANKAQLQAILKYHVVAGRVFAADVVKLTSATTVNGASLAIKVEGDAVKLNGSTTVTGTDVLTSNGVVHVIDTVLLPPTP